MDTAKAFCFYHRNHLDRFLSCAPEDLLNLKNLILRRDCTSDKLRHGRLTFSENFVTKVHHTVTAGHMQTTRVTAHVMDTPEGTIPKIISSMYRFESHQLHIYIAKEFIIQ